MKMSRVRVGVALCAALCATAVGCGAKTNDKVGGETNWLSACDGDEECGAGSCSCGICTRTCENENVCDDIRGSVCSSHDPAAHVGTCGAEDAPPICIALGPSPSARDAGGEEPEPVAPEPAAPAWDDALSREQIDGVTFYRIWGSAEDLWALGTPQNPAPAGTGQSSAALLCPQDWSAMPILRRGPAGGWPHVEHPATTSIQDLHGSGPDDVWMVGLDGAAFHFDGTGWEGHDVRAADGLEFDEASEPCAELSLHSVFARTPSDVWIAGYVFPSSLGPGLVLHFDGDGWERAALDAPDSIFDIWASSESDVWAVGSSGLAYHFDGTAWTKVETNTTEYLHSVFGTGEGDVWMAGNAGTLRHFDGTTLSVRTELEGTTSVGNFSGSDAAGAFLLTSTYAEGQALRQDLFGLQQGTWTSLSHSVDENSLLQAIVATPEGEVWGAGKELIHLR